MFEHHHHPPIPLMQTYLERLQAHMLLTASLREGLLEILGRPNTPASLHGWITETLEQNRLQRHYISRLLRHHGQKPHDDHKTVSTVLESVVSSFPSGDAPLHILSAVLNLAGDIARQRASLALLCVLADRLGLEEEITQLTLLKDQSRIAAQQLKKVLPDLLDYPGKADFS